MTTVPLTRLDRLHLVAAGEAVAALALAAYIWRFGPTGPIPMHFNGQGHVDRWGGRGEAAAWLAGLTLLIAMFYGVFSAMARGESPDSPTWRGIRAARIVMVAVNTFTAVLVSGMVFGRFAPGGSDVSGVPDMVRGRLLAGGLSGLFLVIGAVLGKTGPNPFVGVRVYWSFKSRLAWDKSNRLLGRLLFWIGLTGLVTAPFVPPTEELPALMLAILGSVVLSVIESWRVWRTDPERVRP
jgi:uncharacterized membrane protein